MEERAYNLLVAYNYCCLSRVVNSLNFQMKKQKTSCRCRSVHVLERYSSG